jgi:cytoskeletal protein CcmA (bactofilin family)
MWKKEEAQPQGVPEISTASVNAATPAKAGPSAPREIPAMLPVSPRAAASVSQGIKIKGEVTGTEDLFIDGQIEGKLDLGNASLTIGPNGNVKADVTAREVVVRGRVEGKISGRERIHIWNTGQVTGEVHCERIAIEEGAMLRGKVEAGKVPAKASETRSSPASAGSSGASKAADSPAKSSTTTTATSSAAAGSAAD